jgi:hypothetical protein
VLWCSEPCSFMLLVLLIRAVCVDERTAVLLDTETGIGSIVGTGTGGGFHAAYMIRNREPPAVCERGEPLSYLTSDVQRMVAPQPLHEPVATPSGLASLTANQTAVAAAAALREAAGLPNFFDFGAWQVIGGGSAVYQVDVVRGILSPDPYGPPP